jgi:hypothetical protein
MNIITKDITTVEFGVIVHQVNCQGVMGSGVAKALRDKWPKIYDSYRDAEKLLGNIDVCEIKENLYVVNLFGQDEYKRGIDDHWDRFTSYGAWELALPRLRDYIIRNGLPDMIYFPYNVGCDRGGGDWRIISAMIEEHFPDAIFCKYKG